MVSWWQKDVSISFTSPLINHIGCSVLGIMKRHSGRTLANIWFNKLPSVYPLRLSYCFMESKQFYRLQKRLMNWFPFLRSVQLYNCQKHVQSQNPPKLICTSKLIYYNKILLIWVTFDILDTARSWVLIVNLSLSLLVLVIVLSLDCISVCDF